MWHQHMLIAERVTKLSAPGKSLFFSLFRDILRQPDMISRYWNYNGPEEKGLFEKDIIRQARNFEYDLNTSAQETDSVLELLGVKVK
jgi:hypothetical protein